MLSSSCSVSPSTDLVSIIGSQGDRLFLLQS
jgi:hypothetical protein